MSYARLLVLSAEAAMLLVHGTGASSAVAQRTRSRARRGMRDPAMPLPTVLHQLELENVVLSADSLAALLSEPSARLLAQAAQQRRLPHP